jgi:putative spermidine/putrescine transport system permease protein
MLGLRVFTYTIVALMLLPVLVTFPVALSAIPRISFPPVGLSGRWFLAILGDQVLLATIARSLWLGLCAAAIAVLIALPCAFVIERGRFQGRALLEIGITSPRMIPQIVLALALLVFFEAVGLAESFAGLVISHLRRRPSCG